MRLSVVTAWIDVGGWPAIVQEVSQFFWRTAQFCSWAAENKIQNKQPSLYFLKYEHVFQILNYYISIFVGDTPFALNVKLGTELTTRAVVNQQEAKPRLDFNPKSIEYRLVEKIIPIWTKFILMKKCFMKKCWKERFSVFKFRNFLRACPLITLAVRTLVEKQILRLSTRRR